MLAIASAVIGVIALLNPSQKAEATRHPAGQETAGIDLPQGAEQMARFGADGTGDTITAEVIATPSPAWQEVTISSGDTLSQVFSRLELDTQQMYSILATDKQTKQALSRLLPGDTLLLDIQEGELRKLQYRLSPTQILHIEKADNGYQSILEELPVETRVSHATSTITNSLFGAGLEAGLSDNLLMQLVGIFGWDIDFALDIREGDSFTVVYEQRFVNGKQLDDGAVLAAEFINQGESYRAVRFVDNEGDAHYYTPEGDSMRKAFLRTPVAFSRISSRYGGRTHPVKQTFRMHKGVDYAAATGTPVKSTGDGKIVFRGVKGGYGNVVILQHGGKYSTLYAHLSSFKRGLGVGSRVRQGQVIGYVGKTGLATGPHLHYEFRVNGVHTNPLTVKLPNASPIPEQLKAQFIAQTTPLLAQLEQVKRTQVALLQE